MQVVGLGATGVWTARRFLVVLTLRAAIYGLAYAAILVDAFETGPHTYIGAPAAYGFVVALLPMPVSGLLGIGRGISMVRRGVDPSAGRVEGELIRVYAPEPFALARSALTFSIFQPHEALNVSVWWDERAHRGYVAGSRIFGQSNVLRTQYEIR